MKIPLYLIIAIIVIVVAVVATILMYPFTSETTTTTSSPTTSIEENTTTSIPTSGIRWLTTSSPTKTINTSAICSVQVLSLDISFVATTSTPPEGEPEYTIFVNIRITSTVNETVLIKKIIIDNLNSLPIDMRDQLYIEYENGRQPPVEEQFSIIIPPGYEDRWSIGSSHTVSVIYEYQGVTCRINYPVNIY
ncbi:MAG: hypothetical protein B6U89_01895 [Desulfurococcales archaeon ex4484_58]|nr:MAG: hypothetical protein B6U89_01895 [Desulfurococcales archaeon ex4484_58]